MFQTTNQKIIGTYGENLGKSPESWENMGLSIENDDFPCFHLFQVRSESVATPNSTPCSTAPKLSLPSALLGSKSMVPRSVQLHPTQHLGRKSRVSIVSFRWLDVYMCVYIYIYICG